MTGRYLGAGVYEDDAANAHVETGYSPKGGRNAHLPDVITCPFCGETNGHQCNTSPTGGLVCGACFAVFTGAAGEVDANAARADLWRQATTVHPPDEETTSP